MSRFWSKDIQKLTPYSPGEQPQIENLVKLNTNENPFGPSPKVLAAIKSAASNDLRKYPDPNASELKSAIAENFGLAANQVFVGNSSDEVLAHLFRALLVQEKPLLMPDITYSFYPVWCELFNIDFQSIALQDDFTISPKDYKIANGGIILANPNAPTGIALPLEQIKELLDNNPDSVIIIDEAYVDFADESAISLIDQYSNLVVVQTLSKSRSLAGLRVGYACGNAELIEGLERVKNSFHPYTLNRLSIAGAIAAFSDSGYFEKTRQQVINTRDACSLQLQDLGFSVLPSQTNFLMVNHTKIPASELFAKLRERNIIVRYFSSRRIKNYIRISIGTDDEMALLIKELKDILSI